MGLFDRVRRFFRTEDRLPGQVTERVAEADGQDVQHLEMPAPDVPAAGGHEPGDAEPAETATETAQESVDPQRHRTHTVQPDQTLAQVAELHGVSTEALTELNGLDPDLVFAGQVVRLPHD